LGTIREVLLLTVMFVTPPSTARAVGLNPKIWAKQKVEGESKTYWQESLVVKEKSRGRGSSGGSTLFKYVKIRSFAEKGPYPLFGMAFV